jgi:tetratricopeptide (TPR) repeat protein
MLLSCLVNHDDQTGREQRRRVRTEVNVIPNQRAQTPLDRLHNLLDKVEDRISSLKTRTPDQALEVLQWLDEIDDLTTSLGTASVDLRGESGRIDAIQSTLQDRSANVMLRLLGARGGIAALRPANTPSERWWWYLDQYVAQRTRRDVRNLVVSVVTVIAVIAIAAILYNTFVHPDPIVLARMDASNRAQSALLAGKPDDALAAIDNGLVKAPNEPELLLWRGAILALLQRSGEAQAAWSAARPAFAGDADFLTQRGYVRLLAGDTAGASADTQEAIRLAPDRPQAYLTLASAQETAGDVQGAMASLRTAADLASKRKETQIEAMAKVRLATLMQAIPVPQMTPSSQPAK